MTAPNHALTGAFIGLAIANPWVALPLAFMSHFVCDSIPHYDQPEIESVRIRSQRFMFEQIIGGGILCFLLVLVLIVTQPEHWLTAAIGAFLAASPDLFWMPRWLRSRRTAKDDNHLNVFLKFHHDLQWKTGPKLIWVEAVWFVLFGSLVISHL